MSETMNRVLRGELITSVYPQDHIEKGHRKLAGAVLFTATKEFVMRKERLQNWTGSAEKFDKVAGERDELREFLTSHTIFHQLANMNPAFIADHIDNVKSDDLSDLRKIQTRRQRAGLTTRKHKCNRTKRGRYTGKTSAK